MMTRLVLASASPARKATLRAAGIEPVVIVSDVDEDAVLERASAAHASAHGAALRPADAVLELARAKATAVLSREETKGALVLGCDSMLEFGGNILGKPGDAQTAIARWKDMRGNSGVLHTGHWLIGPDGRMVGATGSTRVDFANLSDREIESYVDTGEPLVVAGGFTIDGRGGPFVECIDGDYHNVVGLSLPLLRRLLGELGLSITQLWNIHPHHK